MSAVKNALVEHEPTQTPAPIVPVSESAAIFQIIERAARDPNVDLDKMERLMAMREREMSRQAEQAFNEAMKAAQSEMRTIGADANNSQTKSRYATYAKLDAVLRPIYTRHGFSVSFDEDDSPKPEHIRCLAYVAHEAGFTRTYRKDMPADGKGAKGGDVMTKTHATGAAASYGQRYLLRGIFNVAVGEEDVDGNAPPDNDNLISEAQAATLRELIEVTETDIEKFCQWAKIEAIPFLLARHYDKAVGVLQARKEKAS
ncbi:ERF family protein [Mesorhizobium sp.]|uniref:ERF family protein n=1 Tax=Mesorhizobium sp. TaxID=1871066 RepID=UPI000FE61A40|nr:ERF family protein [Mesorhizobium sp.]RWN33443.1 MAG: single-stranded DNA-binding protein [Mesorhizobium sp.]